VTPKGQGCDPVIFEAPQCHLHKGVKQTHSDDGPFIVKRWRRIEWSTWLTIFIV